MEWNEPLLIEYEFEIGAGRRKAVARLGFPRFLEEESLWACPLQLSGVKNGLSIFGIKDSHIHLVRGENGLQALSIAVSAIRRSLQRLKAVGGEPYQLLFLKILPICYGLEFHDRLCQIVDAEIAKKERALTRSRLAHTKLAAARMLDRWLAQLWLSQAGKEIPIEDTVDRVRSRMQSANDYAEWHKLALNLKWLLTEARRFDEALQLMDDVIEQADEDVRFPSLRAEFYLEHLEDPEKALESIDLAWKRALRTREFRRKALNVKARILARLGRGEELGQVLEQIMSLKVSRGFRDVPRERDLLDAAPPGLVREDIVARYDEFSRQSPRQLSMNPPKWDPDDPEIWMDAYPTRHRVVCPDGNPIALDELDRMIFSLFDKDYWRKTASVIGHVLRECEDRERATTDTLIFDRVLHLVDAGALESTGSLSMWRYSAVRPVRR